MGYIKKTILLSNAKNDIAVLNIFKDNQNTFGSIKHANFNGDNLILGICVDNVKILKQNLSLVNGGYNFKFGNSFDINSNIGCVIVEKNATNIEPKVWGNNNNIVDFKQKIIDDFKEVDSASKVNKQCKTIVDLKTNIDKDNSDYKDELNEIDKSIENEENLLMKIDEDKLNNEVESQAQSLFEDNNAQIEKEIKEVLKEDTADFFDMISEQIDDLFENNKRDEVLERIIPNSKWVRVKFEENQKEYVVGLVYELGVLKYVCYGVPGDINNNPLTGLEDYSQWLPINDEEGLWVMFQDAKTGENVKYQ